MFTIFWILFISNPLSPSPLQPTHIQPPRIQYTSLRIVSSLTIHPFINQLMTNGIVKPFLHKKTPVLYPLSLPRCDLRHDLYSNSEPDSQPTNYKCGILPGRTDPFPSYCPLTSTTFPPPSMPQWLLNLPVQNHQSHPSPIPSHPIPSLPPTSLL